MSKASMPHLIILLPGIMGSVLQKNGRDVWALSRQALFSGLLSPSEHLSQLRLAGDDPTLDILDDGITADRLISDLYNVPGVIKGSGYAVIQQRIAEMFLVKQGNIATPRPNENFFPFPYDWRRDIRVAARAIEAFVARQLPIWRDHCGKKDAKVLLVAHSMGGLIARYYVEVLGGWKDTLALFTLGTPHRGSVKALDTIVNGITFKAEPISQQLREITTIVRSFTSVYQLLPTYPVIQVDNELLRVIELPPTKYLDQTRARKSRDTLLAISDAAHQNRRDHHYHTSTVPIIGIHQDTFQSAVAKICTKDKEKTGSSESHGNNKLDTISALEMSYLPPHTLTNDLSDGDGTVPAISAIPEEIQTLNLNTERFVVQHHGWLANGKTILDPLLLQISWLVHKGSIPTRGELSETSHFISVHIDDLYASNEPVTFISRSHYEGESLPLEVELVQLETNQSFKQILTEYNGEQRARFERLPVGLYQVIVRPLQPRIGVHGVCSTFEVVGTS